MMWPCGTLMANIRHKSGTCHVQFSMLLCARSSDLGSPVPEPIDIDRKPHVGFGTAGRRGGFILPKGPGPCESDVLWPQFDH